MADLENFGGGDFKHKPSKIRMSSPKLRVIFGPESEIRTFFPPKIRWSPKKKKKKVFTEIESARVLFRPKPLALLLLYCLITVMCVITEKKLQLNIARLCCHNFLSLVGPPWLRLCSRAWAFQAKTKYFQSHYRS